MKVQHYIGGIEGLGPVTFEKRVFVEPWEKRIFGIHVAMMALSSQLPLAATPSKFKTVWTWADLRKGAESLNPLDYFKYRYYEKWLGGISGYFIENGYITAAELEKRTRSSPKGKALRYLPETTIASLYWRHRKMATRRLYFMPAIHPLR